MTIVPVGLAFITHHVAHPCCIGKGIRCSVWGRCPLAGNMMLSGAVTVVENLQTWLTFMHVSGFAHRLTQAGRERLRLGCCVACQPPMASHSLIGFCDCQGLVRIPWDAFLAAPGWVRALTKVARAQTVSGTVFGSAGRSLTYHHDQKRGKKEIEDR